MTYKYISSESKMTKPDYKLSDIVIKNTSFLNQKVLKRTFKIVMV